MELNKIYLGDAYELIYEEYRRLNYRLNKNYSIFDFIEENKNGK